MVRVHDGSAGLAGRHAKCIAAPTTLSWPGSPARSCDGSRSAGRNRTSMGGARAYPGGASSGRHAAAEPSSSGCTRRGSNRTNIGIIHRPGPDLGMFIEPFPLVFRYVVPAVVVAAKHFLPPLIPSPPRAGVRGPRLSHGACHDVRCFGSWITSSRSRWSGCPGARSSGRGWRPRVAAPGVRDSGALRWIEPPHRRLLRGTLSARRARRSRFDRTHHTARNGDDPVGPAPEACSHDDESQRLGHSGLGVRPGRSPDGAGSPRPGSGCPRGGHQDTTGSLSRDDGASRRGPRPATGQGEAAVCRRGRGRGRWLGGAGKRRASVCCWGSPSWVRAPADAAPVPASRRFR